MALTSLVIAASTLAGSVVSTDTKLMPKLSNTLLRSLYVPPYTLSDMMSLSPCLKRLRTVVIAARPDAKAKPCVPFSRSAIRASRAFLVGLPVLEYSKPL